MLLHVGGCIASAHTLPRPKLSGGQRAAAAPSFGTIDHDGDGRVGAAELTAWFAMQQDEMSSRAIPASRAYRTPLACKLHLKGTAACDVHPLNYRLYRLVCCALARSASRQGLKRILGTQMRFGYRWLLAVLVGAFANRGSSLLVTPSMLPIDRSVGVRCAHSQPIRERCTGIPRPQRRLGCKADLLDSSFRRPLCVNP